MTSFFQLALSRNILKNSVKIAVVVGLLLNIINQGGNIWAGTDISWPHIFMNFLVPYCVATYSAVKNNAVKNSAVKNSTEKNNRTYNSEKNKKRRKSL